jgi:hypothetical protein
MPAPSVVTFAGTYILTSVIGLFQMRLTYRTAATSLSAGTTPGPADLMVLVGIREAS